MLSKPLAIISLAGALSLAAATAQTAESGKNLLRNTRLVAGLPGGWIFMNKTVPVFSEGDDFVAHTDDTVKGPSGYPTFLVDVLSKQGVPGPYGLEQQLYFCTEPFRVPEDGEFTASVYLRGNGKGTLEIIGDGGSKKAETPFSITEEAGWQRISCRFKGSKSDRLYSLWFRIEGKLWFDAFQVNPGKEATAYASQFPAEVALSPAKGDASQVRIQFDDEAARVEWTVTGARKGDVLKGRVVDLDQKASDLPSVTLDGNLLQTGSWNYALPGIGPLGQFRIETWIEGHPFASR